MPDIKTVVAVAIYLAITGIINLLIGHKSQIDTWAESKPRLAAALKLLRGVGFDPWLLLQSLSLAVSKRLPAAVRNQDPLPEKSSIGKLPPLALLCLAFALIACSGGDADDKDFGVASIQQGLISPSCLTLHSPPPYPIKCGNYCATPSGTCALSSYSGNPYSRDVVGRPCKCAVGGAIKIEVPGTVAQ